MAAIAVHHTETDTGAWDGPANEGRLESGRNAAYYARAFAWRDPDGDETAKSAYRFIHHFVASDGASGTTTPGAASTRGCSAGIAVLNGGRGGTTIPDADREGVWRHLAAHLRDAELEPPDLRGDSSAVSTQPQNDMGDVERRSVPAVELRVLDEGMPQRIVGYAALFNVLSESLGGFRERIAPGAFTGTLGDDVRALWQHDTAHVLGRTKSGTLILREDERGLWTETIPPDAQWARDAVASVRRGDVSEMSFAFRMIRDEWATDAASGELVRTLHQVRLFDVSPVTYPAYAQTSAQVRSRVAELQRGTGTGVPVPPEVELQARARRAARLRRLEIARADND